MDDLGVEHALLTILTVRKLFLNDGDEVNGDDGDDGDEDGGDDGDDDDGGDDSS